MTEASAVSEQSAEPALPALGPLALRVALGLAGLIAVASAVGSLFRAELEALGRAFVGQFGLFGLALGTMISDALHAPVPPPFYMLLGISSGVSSWGTIVSVSIGSMLGSWIAYYLAKQFGTLPWLERRLLAPRRVVELALERYGYWALVIASFLPITYAALCYLCGISRIPPKAFVLITLIRIPRLIAYYYLVRLGWEGF